MRGQDLLLGNAIAHEDDYEYETRGMADVDPDLHRELEMENYDHWGVERHEGEDQEEENSDMDKESDSDDDD